MLSCSVENIFVSFQPRQWYDLWSLAQERYWEGEENYLEKKNRITKRLIAAQDEKSKQARERAQQLEQKVAN